MPALLEVIRHICLSFPDAEEVPSRGSPDFRIHNKTFATFVVNHHGDQRVALWIPASPETQQVYVNSAPDIFFVPPYVGTRGWYGVELNKGLRWHRVAELLCDAYMSIAPAGLAHLAQPPRDIPEPDTVALADLDPLYAPHNQALLATLRTHCFGFPEVVEADQFGAPCFRAGKKTFATFNVSANRTALSIWVGVERQTSLTLDPRYRIPPYSGHNGWIDLDITERQDWTEIAALLEESYRHFALKRMLKGLEDNG
ncbi:MAG: MmcQ/YjbR family DNA-binding protein [Pseudomonadales bacterium]|nr:MmcQ/YjbR family DNA-binding protein [Pseudomonadales bacterium]